MPNLLVIDGHPDPGRLTSTLTDAYASAAEAAGADVTVTRVDLRSLAFDPILRRGYDAPQPLEPDLVHAQQSLLRSTHVAWFFPTWWTAPPALVKGFVDRVLLPGFAFRYRGRMQAPEKLLTGRSARFVTTMDTPSFWYTLAYRRALHSTFGSATLGFVGFAPVKSTTFHEARFLDEKGVAQALVAVAKAANADVRNARNARRALPAVDLRVLRG